MRQNRRRSKYSDNATGFKSAHNRHHKKALHAKRHEKVITDRQMKRI